MARNLENRIKKLEQETAQPEPEIKSIEIWGTNPDGTETLREAWSWDPETRTYRTTLRKPISPN